MVVDVVPFDAFAHALVTMEDELVLQYTEMSGPLLRDSLSVCTAACKKYPDSHEKAAKRIKQTMDRRHGSSWHVVVGASFGLEVTHEVRNILYLICCSKFAVCLWRCSHLLIRNGMEPCVTREQRSNPFDIRPLLRKFEKQLRQEIVLLSTRRDPAHPPTPPPPPRRRERQQNAQQLQQDWERLKRDILDGQHGGAFTYRLRNLEHMEHMVLFTDQCAGPSASPRSQRSSFDAGRSHLPSVDVAGSPSDAPVDAEVDEGFKTPPMSNHASPLSSLPSFSPSSPSSSQSPRSSQSPALARSWSEFSASGAVRQSSSSSQGGLLRRSRSQENSPRARVEAIGFKERVKVFKKRYPRRERTLDDLRDIRQSHSPQQQWWEPMSDAPSYPEVDQEVDVTDLEGVHESLDRMSKIMSEMALLINISTMQQPPIERHGHRRSSSSAARRRMSRARRASRYHHGGSQSPATSEGSGILLGMPDASPSRPTHSSSRSSPRDLALFPTSDETQVSWRRGSHLRPQRRRERRPTSTVKTVAEVTERASDEDADLSWGFSDSELSDSKKLDVPRRPLGSQSDLELSHLQGPESDTADERVASVATEERFPGPFLVRKVSLVACSDELSVDRSGLFEAASPYESKDGGRLSPGEVMLSRYTDDAGSLSEPVFPSLQPEERRLGFTGSARSVMSVDPSPGEIMLASYPEGAGSVPEASFPPLRPEDRERGFRGIARSVSWTDPERCHTQFFGAADDLDDSLPRSSSDEGLHLGGMRLGQGAKEDAYPSQHIWRYANSETGRVVDEAAMRRLEVYKTTLVDNIDGQPPHMKAPSLRLASNPDRVPGQRMCRLQIVCIITPVTEEPANAPTSSEPAAPAAAQPSSSNPPQMRP